MRHLLTIGFGYTARAVAAALTAQEPGQWRVFGTSRDPAQRDAIAAAGAVPVILPEGPGGCEPSALPDPSGVPVAATHILVSAPPGPDGCPVLAGLAARIKAAPVRPAWIGLFSTIGVYGERDGGWVDENDPRDTALDRGRARIAQEDGWLAFGRETGVPVQVFRLAGIYGPGRSALDRVWQPGVTRTVKPGHVFNRIHVADIADIVAAGIRQPTAGPDFNLADDLPAPAGAPLAYAARLKGVPTPPEVPFDPDRLSPMALSFYAECKRVRNDRAKALLGRGLRYPTFRDGLAALAGIDPPPPDAPGEA